MRIYLPLTAQDRPMLEARRGDLALTENRRAWAVHTEARAERPGQDEEELEYDALQDAVHVAFTSAQPAARVLVIAADVPDRAVAASPQDGGPFGIALAAECSARIASFHVTEQDAAEAEQDDTDPALLWFDASEGPDALGYLDLGARGGEGSGPAPQR